MTPIPVNQASFTLDDVARHTGGRVVGDGSRVVVSVITDSRRATKDSLFVALRGERHDAHAFVDAVAKTGAASLTERGRGQGDHVEVDDTLVALGDLARAHRRAWGGTLVAITGSAGKTSTKELTAAALRGAGQRVRATEGNLNNRIGVPMTLFTLTADDEVAVVEMGTSEKGEIAELARIGEPNVAVVTLVAVAHTEGLGNVDAVGREKRSLLVPDAIGIVNGDDPQLKDHGSLRFGEQGEVTISEWGFDGDRTRGVFDVAGTRVETRLRLVGEAAVRNASAALAVVHALKLDLEAAAKGLEEVQPVSGRMRPIAVGNSVVLDDTYNANPMSMSLALRTAAQIAQQRGSRLQAVLGDMKELGSESENAHREVRALATELCDEVVFVGPEMAALGVAVADETAVSLTLDGVLLVKGSRSMRLERVVQRITGVAA